MPRCHCLNNFHANPSHANPRLYRRSYAFGFGQWESVGDVAETAAESSSDFYGAGQSAFEIGADSGLDAAISSSSSFWDSWAGRFIEEVLPKLAISAAAAAAQAALSAALAPQPQQPKPGQFANPYGFGPSSQQYFRSQQTATPPQQVETTQPTQTTQPAQQPAQQVAMGSGREAPPATSWALPAAIVGAALLAVLALQD